MNRKPGTIFPALPVTGGAILLILASAGAHPGHDDVADGVNVPAFFLAQAVTAPVKPGPGWLHRGMQPESVAPEAG